MISSEARAGKKLEKDNGEKEETADFLPINPHTTETMPEEKINKKLNIYTFGTYT
jgi:hypothetical protein